MSSPLVIVGYPSGAAAGTPVDGYNPNLGPIQQHIAVGEGAGSGDVAFEGLVQITPAPVLPVNAQQPPAYNPPPPLAPWQYSLTRDGISIDGFTGIARTDGAGDKYLAVANAIYDIRDGETTYAFYPQSCGEDQGGFGLVFGNSALDRTPGLDTPGAMLYIAESGWYTTVNGSAAPVAGSGAPQVISVAFKVTGDTGTIRWHVDNVLVSEVTADLSSEATWAPAANLSLTGVVNGFVGHYALIDTNCSDYIDPNGGEDLCQLLVDPPVTDGNWEFSALDAGNDDAAAYGYRTDDEELYAYLWFLYHSTNGEPNDGSARTIATLTAPPAGAELRFDYKITAAEKGAFVGDSARFQLIFYYRVGAAPLVVLEDPVIIPPGDLPFSVTGALTALALGPSETFELGLLVINQGDGATVDVETTARITNFGVSGSAAATACGITTDVDLSESDYRLCLICQGEAPTLGDLIAPLLSNGFIATSYASVQPQAESRLNIYSYAAAGQLVHEVVQPLNIGSLTNYFVTEVIECLDLRSELPETGHFAEASVTFGQEAEIDPVPLFFAESELNVTSYLPDVADLQHDAESSFTFVVEEAYHGSSLPDAPDPPIPYPGQGVLYVMNMNTTGVTRYLGIDAVAVGSHDGRALIITDGRLLEMGPDDGSQISATLRTGALEHGTQDDKHCHRVYVTGRAANGLDFTTYSTEHGVPQERIYNLPAQPGDNSHTRFKGFGRGAVSPYWGLGVANVSGGPIDFTKLELLIGASKRPR